MKAKGSQKQAENADRAQPEDVGDQVACFRLFEQYLVPNQRNSDQSIGNDGDKHPVANESQRGGQRHGHQRVVGKGIHAGRQSEYVTRTAAAAWKCRWGRVRVEEGRGAPVRNSGAGRRRRVPRVRREKPEWRRSLPREQERLLGWPGTRSANDGRGVRPGCGLGVRWWARKSLPAAGPGLQRWRLRPSGCIR